MGNCACSSTWTPYVHSCCNECIHKYQTLCKYHINSRSRRPISLCQQPLNDCWIIRVLTRWVQIFLSLSSVIGVSTPSASTQLILLNSMFPCVIPGRCHYCLMATIQRLYKMTFQTFAFLLSVILALFWVKQSPILTRNHSYFSFPFS